MGEPVPPPYSVIFMGSPDFSVPSLQALHQDPAFRIRAVFSMPDRPKGRGHKETMTPVKARALDLGLPVHTPASLKRQPEFVDIIRTLAPHFLVVVAYGLILPRSVLEAATIGPVNLHASLLPAYRGSSPIHYALLNGDSITGSTVMLMDEKMDEGPILATDSFPVTDEDTLASVHDRLAERGAPLLVQTLKEYAAGRIRPQPQDHSRATYTTKITVEMARLDWRKPASVLSNLVRAMTPFPGAWAEYEGERLKVGKVKVGNPGQGEPGTILTADPEQGVAVACGDGTTLRLLSLQRPGKALLPVGDFLRGFSFRIPRFG